MGQDLHVNLVLNLVNPVPCLKENQGVEVN